MSVGKTPQMDIAEVENDPKVLKGRALNIELFKDWFRGMPMVRMAEKYGISRQRINDIKVRDKWKQLADELREREYTALAREWKTGAAKITAALGRDWDRVVRKIMSDENVTLTTDERNHGRMMLDLFMKATRLADDKPTEITDTSGTVTHRVLLPPGVKRWGVIPPDARVEQVESDEDKPKKKPKISHEDLTDMDDT